MVTDFSSLYQKYALERFPVRAVFIGRPQRSRGHHVGDFRARMDFAGSDTSRDSEGLFLHHRAQSFSAGAAQEKAARGAER